MSALIESMSNSPNGSFLHAVGDFIQANKVSIEKEIVVSEEAAAQQKWLLDLTLTSLRGILAHMSGREMTALSVICDRSKPLLSQAHLFDSLMANRELSTLTFDGVTHQLTFNLAGPIVFGDSHESAGIQLADLVSGAVAFSLKNPTHELSKVVRDNGHAIMESNSVFCDDREFHGDSIRVNVNKMILNELLIRSKKKGDLLFGMPEFIQDCNYRAHQSFRAKKMHKIILA